MVRLIFILFLFLASSVSAVNLSSIEEISGRVYSLLNLDTTGVANLDTSQVNIYANMGIKEVNEQLDGYKRTENITITDDGRASTMDSVISITSCILINGGNSTKIRYLDSRRAIDSVLSKANELDEDKPEVVWKWGDSLFFLPVPNDTNTVQFYTVHLIPADSIRLLPDNFRLGVVYYAAMMAAFDVNMTGKATVYKQLYDNFIATRRGSVAVE
jgi:hypothetical protein